MRICLGAHEPGALLSVIAKQRQDQAVPERSDAAHRQTPKRREARSMAAAGTKPPVCAAHKHDSSEIAKAAGLKAERNRRHGNKCFSWASKVIGSVIAPKVNSIRGENAFHGQSQGQSPKQQLQSTSGPA